VEIGRRIQKQEQSLRHLIGLVGNIRKTGKPQSFGGKTHGENSSTKALTKANQLGGIGQLTRSKPWETMALKI
jgi:hypothetical protein